MEYPDFKTHPLVVIKKVMENYGENLYFMFHKYKYIPTVQDIDREVIIMPAKEITEPWFKSMLDNLTENQNIALQSVVKIGNKNLHMPMIDFSTSELEKALTINKIVTPHIGIEPILFASGRSFHAYYPALLTHKQWTKTMGLALLCNMPGEDDIVDQRYIGHRIIAGQSSLRWTCNTVQYKAYPTLTDELAEKKLKM